MKIEDAVRRVGPWCGELRDYVRAVQDVAFARLQPHKPMLQRANAALNKATREQLVHIILLDCIEKCNAMCVDKATYERELRAMLRERIDYVGQRAVVL